jgi:hypothetical protein
VIIFHGACFVHHQRAAKQLISTLSYDLNRIDTSLDHLVCFDRLASHSAARDAVKNDFTCDQFISFFLLRHANATCALSSTFMVGTSENEKGKQLEEVELFWSETLIISPPWCSTRLVCDMRHILDDRTKL